MEPNKMYYIPVKDKSGIPKDKVLRVKEGSEIYKQLIAHSKDGKFPNCYIIEEE